MLTYHRKVSIGVYVCLYENLKYGVDLLMQSRLQKSSNVMVEPPNGLTEHIHVNPQHALTVLQHVLCEG